jgi:hypothetical protein
VLIGNLITRAQAWIETYTGRKFDEATYREWHNGSRQVPLPLRNWPVTAVKRMAYGSQTALTVTGSTASDLRATVEVQDDGIVLSRFASDGTEAATTLAFADYPTASDMATQVSSETGWTGTVGTNWITADLHRMGGQDAKGLGVPLTYPSESDIEYRIDEDTGIVEIIGGGAYGWPGWGECPGKFPNGYQNILVHYTAGYADGSIPADLEQIAIMIVADLYHAGEHDGTLKSESLGDYSYTRGGDSGESDRLTSKFGDMLAMWRDRRS